MQRGFARLPLFIPVALISLALLLVVAGILIYQSNQNEPPPKIVANFVNLDKVEKISKYRSCTGHVVVPQNEKESKRNMKHYLVEKDKETESQVEIYAPFDGYVTFIFRLSDQEQEIWVSQKRMLANLIPLNLWSFSVEHIKIREGLKVGDEVKAGELIGYTGFLKDNHSFDAIFGKIGMPPKKIDGWMSPFADLDSMFNHMSDEVFSQFQKKGVSSKDEMIISKEERDQNPCQYRGEGPELIDQDQTANWVILK